MPSKIGVFHPGTQHSWQTALAFQEGQQLEWYATSIFYDPSKWPYRIEKALPKPFSEKAHRQFSRRYNAAIDRTLVRQMGAAEWLAQGASAMKLDRLAERTTRYGNQQFAHKVIALIKREPVDIVWGPDTGSLEVFRWAKQRGVHCVLDRTIGHSAAQNQVMSEEYAKHPEFFTQPFKLKPNVVLDEEQEEIDLADIVVVGSQFCANTLIQNGCSPGKVRVLRYGYDERLFPGIQPQRKFSRKNPVKFLFVGNISARKGVAYLLNAIMKTSEEEASLTMVGRMSIPESTFDRYKGRVTHLPFASRQEVVRNLIEADCFIFPSLFEGSAIVLREIYGAGLGAIQSFVAGDGVTDGQNGLIMPLPTVDGIISAMSAVVGDRECLSRWQQLSWDMRGIATWSSYRQAARVLLNSIGQ